MREYKFRAWDTFTKKMVFEGFNVIGEVTCFNGIEHYGNEHPNPAYESSLMRLNDFILMQFTGLTDKNGVDVYEGDILRHIEMDKGWYTTQEYEKLDVIKCEGYNRWTALWSFYEYEIIGNIYENPELLED